MKTRSLGSLIIAVIVAQAGLQGGEVNRSWDELLRTIKDGKKVVVTRMNSAKVEGKLLGINAESITVEREKQPQVVRREDVFRVRYADIRMRHTLWGMLAGAAGGAAILAGAADDFKGISALGGAVMGVGVGAAVGGSLPIGPPLYEVAKPAPARP